MEQLKGLGTLFYVVNPYETMFEKVSDLPTPDWTAKVIPIWFQELNRKHDFWFFRHHHSFLEWLCLSISSLSSKERRVFGSMTVSCPLAMVLSWSWESTFFPFFQLHSVQCMAKTRLKRLSVLRCRNSFYEWQKLKSHFV